MRNAEMHECKNARMPRHTRLTRRVRIRAFLHLCIRALLVSACASAQAKGAAAGPPLDVPAPPPRVVEPVDGRGAAAVAAARGAAARARAAGPPGAPRRRPPRVRRRPGADAAAAEPPNGRGTTEAAAATTLQTTPRPQRARSSAGFGPRSTRATADLSRIDYRALNADARSAVRHGQAVHPAGRGSDSPEESRLREESGRQGCRACRVSWPGARHPTDRQYLATDLKHTPQYLVVITA